MRIAAALALLLLASSPQSPSARDQLNGLNARARKAVEAGDQQTRITVDLEILQFLNGAPSVVEALARAYTAAGDTQKALAALNRFAGLGQADDNLLNGSDKRLAPLEPLPEYKQVLERFRQNETPLSLGIPVLTLPDAGLLTEDIDYDSVSRSFLVTSVLKHKIVRASLTGEINDFAPSPDQWPMLAIKVDSARRRVWATEVALDGFTSAPKDAWGRSAVLCYDLSSGKLLQRIEGPPHTALADMVLTSSGDPILSDGAGGGLYRVTSGALRPLNTTDFISPQTPVLLPGGNRILVPDYVRGLALVNLESGKVDWLNSAPADQEKIALDGVDGVYLHNQHLVLTQNGTSPQRVLSLELDPSLTRITGSKVIAQASNDYGDPTHGVFVGDDFFYIANSGWNQLDDHGDVKTGAKMTSAHIMRYSLQ